MQKILVVLALVLAGCVSLADVDVSGKDPVCARGCTESYSTCAGRALSPTILSACKEALQLCLKTCPTK